MQQCNTSAPEAHISFVDKDEEKDDISPTMKQKLLERHERSKRREMMEATTDEKGCGGGGEQGAGPKGAPTNDGSDTEHVHRFIARKRVGTGAYGSVHKAMRVEDKKEFAIKVIGSRNEQETADAMAEYRVCSEVKGHPNVIHVHEVFIDECDMKTTRVVPATPEEQRMGLKEVEIADLKVIGGVSVPTGLKYICTVMDYHYEGTLYDYLWAFRKVKAEEFERWQKEMVEDPGCKPPKYDFTVLGLPEKTVWKFMRQLFDAVVHLHNRKILHRDVKPGNVLMADCQKRLVLTDFGLSRVLESGEYAHTAAGTLPYIAPEQVSCHYTHKSDVWGMGCLLYNMCTLRITRADVRMMFQDCCHPKFPQEIRSELRGYSDALVHFLLKALSRNYKDRPTAEEALEICNNTVQAYRRKRRAAGGSDGSPNSQAPSSSTDSSFPSTISGQSSDSAKNY